LYKLKQAFFENPGRLFVGFSLLAFYSNPKLRSNCYEKEELDRIAESHQEG